MSIFGYSFPPVHIVGEAYSYLRSVLEEGREDMSSVQSQIQQDWNNREFVETIASSIKRIAEFLNAFDLSARSRSDSLSLPPSTPLF